MDVKLEDIQRTVYELGKLIDAPKTLLIVHWRPVDDGTPYVVIEKDHFLYISSERGYEFSRKKTSSLQELLYWIFSNVTSIMSMEYELKNRVKGQDSRRIYFQRQIDLLRMINIEWANKAQVEIKNILISSPYVDGL
jgi:hypothetical protein